MSDEAFLLHQEETRDFVNAIEDPTVRLLVRGAVCSTMAFLVGDATYNASWRERPFDMLLFARATYAHLRHTDVLRAALDGTIVNIEEYIWFPRSK